MKIKRFKNLWTMGLIIFGAILILFYFIKLINPNFIIGIAEIPSVISFGQYVDSHKWAFHLFNFAIGFIGGYIYSCACCRKRKLSLKGVVVLVCVLVLLRLCNIFLPQQYTTINYVSLAIMPFIICLLDKNLSKETFISTMVCFSIDILSQVLSKIIRDLPLLVGNINSATMTILLIDGIIWKCLLYCYFNNNENKKEVV